MTVKTSRFANASFQMKQIWVIFTHLSLPRTTTPGGGGGSLELKLFDLEGQIIVTVSRHSNLKSLTQFPSSNNEKYLTLRRKISISKNKSSAPLSINHELLYLF